MTHSRPLGWNLYADVSSRDITLPRRFLRFVPDEPVLDEAAGRLADDIEAYAAAEVTCGAVLFPLPSDLLTDLVRWAGEPVHPDIARQCGPVLGPRSAVCAREKDHPGSWHHDGRGTWFR